MNAIIITSLVFWAFALFILYDYISNKSHPNRSSLSAFLVFSGIFFGAALVVLFVVVAITYSIGGFSDQANSSDEGSSLAKKLGPTVLIATLIPIWQFAVKKIEAAPKLKNERKDK